VFQWNAQAKDAATVKFLQDGRTVRLRFETCTPSRGFDHCIIVHGDPTGAERYQSRKRWVVRRPGKKAFSPAAVVEAFSELVDDDRELQATFATGE
jgi:hypothetical protein